MTGGLGVSREQKENCRLWGREGGFGRVVWLGPRGRPGAGFFVRNGLVVWQPWWLPWQLGSCDSAPSAGGAQEIWLWRGINWLHGCAGSWRGSWCSHCSLGSLAARCARKRRSVAWRWERWRTWGRISEPVFSALALAHAVSGTGAGGTKHGLRGRVKLASVL